MLGSTSSSTQGKRKNSESQAPASMITSQLGAKVAFKKPTPTMPMLNSQQIRMGFSSPQNHQQQQQ